MVHPAKAVVATASLAGTAMAYYGNGRNDQHHSHHQHEKNFGNGIKKQETKKSGTKLHDDAVKQMQMWKSF